MARRAKGAIVSLSTMVADYGAAGMALYGSSKAAFKLLTKARAAEYGPSGVWVNAVSSGPTRTEGTGAMGEGHALDRCCPRRWTPPAIRALLRSGSGGLH